MLGRNDDRSHKLFATQALPKSQHVGTILLPSAGYWRWQKTMPRLSIRLQDSFIYGQHGKMA